MLDIHTIILLIAVLVFTYLGSHLYRLIAIQQNTLAAVNQRSAHARPVPTGSGSVLVVLFLITIAILLKWHLISLDLFLACLGPLLVGVVGYIDDRGSLPVKARAPVYLLAACWVMSWLGFPDININGMIVNFGFAGWLFGVISLFWLQNLFNFMDGIDGIAASEVVFVCFSAIVIGGISGIATGAVPLLCLISGLMALGYLIINWPQAKLFMGDAGSSFFGLLLGIFALSSDALSIWVWMILMCQFLVDACLTISIRLSKRERIHEPHSQHAYQHLNRALGTRRTLWLSIGINVLWLLPMAILAHRFSDKGLILLLLAALPIIIKDWLSGAGNTLPRMVSLRAS